MKKKFVILILFVLLILTSGVTFAFWSLLITTPKTVEPTVHINFPPDQTIDLDSIVFEIIDKNNNGVIDVDDINETDLQNQGETGGFKVYLQPEQVLLSGDGNQVYYRHFKLYRIFIGHNSLDFQNYELKLQNMNIVIKLENQNDDILNAINDLFYVTVTNVHYNSTDGKYLKYRSGIFTDYNENYKEKMFGTMLNDFTYFDICVRSKPGAKKESFDIIRTHNINNSNNAIDNFRISITFKFVDSREEGNPFDPVTEYPVLSQ